jgi:hypothetical protein
MVHGGEASEPDRKAGGAAPPPPQSGESEAAAVDEQQKWGDWSGDVLSHSAESVQKWWMIILPDSNLTNSHAKARSHGRKYLNSREKKKKQDARTKLLNLSLQPITGQVNEF